MVRERWRLMVRVVDVGEVVEGVWLMGEVEERWMAMEMRGRWREVMGSRVRED